jgi:hypothetical protein
MQLLSRIIRTGDLASVVSWGVGHDDFCTSEGRAMFEFVTQYSLHPETSGSVIGVNAMPQYFPTFVLCDDPSMTTEALCRQVRQDRLNIQINFQVSQALAITDPIERAQQIQSAMLNAVNLGYGKNTDIRAAVGADRVRSNYRLREQGIDMSVGRWPWALLDDELGGFTSDDYVVLFGRPKSFKSWILVYLITSLMTQGKRILVYTKEMTWEQMYERIICCLSEIRHWNLRKGLLSPEERILFEQTVEMLLLPEISNQLIILSGMDAHGHDTIPWIRSKIENYKPQFVAIDGMHLMADVHKSKKREEKITNISREARSLVLQTGVPVIATVQANRAAAKNQEANLDEIAYSDALGQDATAVMRTIKDKVTEENQESTVSLVIGALRNGMLDGFRIHAQPATNFRFHSRLTALEAAKLKDQEDKEPKTKTNGAAKQMTEHTAAQEGKAIATSVMTGRLVQQ